MLLVSHDRALLEAVGSRTLVCEDGELRELPERLGRRTSASATKQAEAAAAERAAKRERPAAARSTAPPSRRRKRRARRRSWSERIEEAEAELRELEEELADPAAWSSPGRVERASKRHAAAKRAVEELYEEWEAAEAARVSAAGDRA